MCGIVGYVGKRQATPFLLEGLQRLEYRGYDSAGIAVGANGDGRLRLTKVDGRMDRLRAAVGPSVVSPIGIGHTRWATHGPPTQANAHPHLGGSASVAIVHNGVIENYQILKDQLLADGQAFQSATDSEVLAHLIARNLEAETVGNERLAQAAGNGQNSDSLIARYAAPIAAVKAALTQVRGTYGLVVLFRDYPELLIAARLGSPLVIGVGDGEHFVASDTSALAGHTNQIVYLADHQLAVLTADRMHVTDRESSTVAAHVETLELVTEDVQLGHFPHYMLKEIFEQPEAVENTMRGRLSDDDASAVFGGLNLSPQDLSHVRRIVLTACGTSWHAALVGEYLIEEFARIPVDVEYASELRYRNPPLDPQTLVFAITQSGETADTLAALREVKRKGHPTLAICNVVGSSIAQEATGGIYLHAGPEIGVASTKAYTSQCVALTLLALYFGRLRHMSFEAGQRTMNAIRELPNQLRQVMETHDRVKQVAEKYCHADNFLYLGRQYNFPTALEGALKLKEISYIHAEGYPAAEMKHGPIALVDRHTPSVVVMPQGFVYEKVMANLEEIKARGGPVIAIAAEGDKQVGQLADDVIHVPDVEPFLQPVVTIVPLQLLAYHVALLRGCDVDKPRNLAKSVTVE